jgi:hypothetical protein
MNNSFGEFSIRRESFFDSEKKMDSFFGIDKIGRSQETED